MVSDAQAHQCRPALIHSYAVAGIRRAGDGVQRFGGDGKGALSFWILFSAPPIGLGDCRLRCHAGWHEGGLQTAEASWCRVFIAWPDHADADLGLLPRPRPQYPSLDTLRRLLVSAFGTGQAGADPVSRLLSREPHKIDARLAEHADTGGTANARIHRSDRLPARPWDRHRLRGDYGLHVVRCR